jgi:hypothetical protein
MSRPLPNLQRHVRSLSLRACARPTQSRPFSLKWFIYRKNTATHFCNSLNYRLSTFAGLCNPLIARVCTTLHANKNYFPPTYFAISHPKSSPTQRDFHASKMLTSDCLYRLRILTKPASSRICTANRNFFTTPRSATLSHSRMLTVVCNRSLSPLRSLAPVTSLSALGAALPF